MTEPRRILFIVVSRIGDTLFSTPALRAVADRWPRAEITVLAHPKRKEVLQGLPYVARVGGITKNIAWLSGLTSLRRYDLAFVYGFDIPLVKFALSVSDAVIAFRQQSETINARLWVAVDVPPFQSEHAVHQLLRLPMAAGAMPSSGRIDFHLSRDEVIAATSRLSLLGISGQHPLVGFQIASFPTKGYRDWPKESFLDLARRITEKWPAARFIVFGGKDEVERTNWLADRIGPLAADFSGKLTLRQTAALMSQLDLYVGVDTGPTHIMSAFDKPMIALYHCLSPSHHTGPLDHPLAITINHPDSEDDCSVRSDMKQISVESVWQAVQQLLAEHPPR